MADLERLDDSVTGFGLWREPTEAGGYRYYTDDNSLGRVFWDEALDDPRLVFEILDREGSLHDWLNSYYKAKSKYEETVQGEING
jgi:hypothetical protein